jgi:hypothetical protein
MLGEFSAVARWISPEAEADGRTIAKLLGETVSSDKREDTFAVLEHMDEGHPAFPHWYLPSLARSSGARRARAWVASC